MLFLAVPSCVSNIARALGFRFALPIDPHRKVVKLQRLFEDRETKMPIWELVPIDRDDDSWIGFPNKVPAIVRAPDESGARGVAEANLSKGWTSDLGSLLGASPWQDPDLSSCQRLENSEYEEDGPDDLLHPLGK